MHTPNVVFDAAAVAVAALVVWLIRWDARLIARRNGRLMDRDAWKLIDHIEGARYIEGQFTEQRMAGLIERADYLLETRDPPLRLLAALTETITEDDFALLVGES